MARPLAVLLAATILSPPTSAAESVFDRKNLVAWCVVPFDATKRSPEDRAAMLKRLGFARFAYDWRAEHLPTFDRELAALKANGIELTAVWFPATLTADARLILDALKRHNLKTQLWVTMHGGPPAPPPDEQRKRVAAHAAAVRPVAEAAAAIGCTVGLYNHGGWFGEPENQLAVIDALKLSNVGIVYNLHHGHDHLDRFPELLKRMLPHLLALNLNGMTAGGDKAGKKILPLGQGEADLGLLKAVAASGYRGPVGILGHTQDDAEDRLHDNLDGLDWLSPQLAGNPPGPAPRPRTAAAIPPTPPVDLADWTPRPATGKAEPWEKATDKDWTDARFRQTDTGPFFDATLDYRLDKKQERIYKATAVRVGDGGVVFDRATMKLAAGWAGGYLRHADRRFGLLNTPTPAGEMVFALPAGPGWMNPDGPATKPPYTVPLPKDWVRYRGLHLHGDAVTFDYTVGGTEVLDATAAETLGGARCFVRTLRVGPAAEPLTVAAGRFPFRNSGEDWEPDVQAVNFSLPGKGNAIVAAVLDRRTGVLHEVGGGEVRLTLHPSKTPRVVRLVYAQGEDLHLGAVREAARTLPPAADLTKPGPTRWGKPLVMKLSRGSGNGSFAVDTLTIPYENPYKALFFCTGLDFLPDGRIAVCTAHGDVWLVSVEEAAGTCSWQRFATGLYHPLGLKVVDGKVVVLERGQLTRLHDGNADGEADFYECVTNDWHTGGGEHSYDTCLETDPEGNFYFFKTGDTHTPHGGCLMRASKDGSKVEVFATGFRHPIGLGMSPTGILTGADQEGNWMPATRIDQYTKGGFYGDFRAHHRSTPPTTFDPPLCWVPREVDNSAGGQVWVPAGTWGPLGGLPLHLSYGRCKAFVLLRQELPNGLVQGGVADLGLSFLSGVCRGRFRPADGHLYVCGLNGWQTSAKADGCLQRVRSLGTPPDVPAKLAVEGDAVRLTFARPLAPAAADPANWRAAAWNYRWSKEYGSKRWKPSDPAAEGQDDVPVRSVSLADDGRTAVLRFDAVRPVMQMQAAYHVPAADGKPVVGSVLFTVHPTGVE